MTVWFFSSLFLLCWMAVAAIRVAAGPTAPDRVVALDTINVLVVATMALLAVAFNQFFLIDIALVYALLSFVATLYIARMLEVRGWSPTS